MKIDQNQNNNNKRNSQLDLNDNDLKNIMKKIKQLQQENQQLKKQLQNQIITQKSNKPKSIQIQTQPSNQLPHPFSKLTFSFKQSPELSLLKYQPRTFQNSLQIDFNQIKLGKKIAQGGYGIIYKGQWRKTQIAIKIFKIQQTNHTATKDFISQCHAMQTLRHPNIVMFLGACVKPPHFAIVLQYCENGTLWSMLQNKKTSLPWQTRINIALQISRAMTYLHNRPNPIVHRDLKSLNILLTENNKIKLADFGWTKGLSNYMTSKIGTYQWMAPEVVSTQQYTEKADVYSFGIILWEIASRQPPYRNIQGIQVAYDVVNKGLRPTMPENLPEKYEKLMVNCWDKQPTKRPSFKQIIQILENQIEQLKNAQNI